MLGAPALTVTAIAEATATIEQDPSVVIGLLAVVYGATAFQQSVVFGVCLDIGRRDAGTVVGLMNTATQIGGLVGSVAFGYIVERFGNYDAPFVPMVTLLLLGAALWLKVDASRELDVGL